MEKVKKGTVTVGFVENLGNKWIGHSNFHNMREYFGVDVFASREEAVQFVLDLNEDYVDTDET